jgi:hypothetical protein
MNAVLLDMARYRRAQRHLDRVEHPRRDFDVHSAPLPSQGPIDARGVGPQCKAVVHGKILGAGNGPAFCDIVGRNEQIESKGADLPRVNPGLRNCRSGDMAWVGQDRRDGHARPIQGLRTDCNPDFLGIVRKVV